MLGLRRRRWPNIKPEYVLFSGTEIEDTVRGATVRPNPAAARERRARHKDAPCKNVLFSDRVVVLFRLKNRSSDTLLV